MFKKIMSLVLALTLMCGLAMPAFAATYEESVEHTFLIDGQEYTIEDIADKAGLDPERLYQYYLEEPDEFIRQAEDLYKEDVLPVIADGVVSSDEASNLEALVAMGRIGDILISATNKTAMINHGHAALVFTYELIVHAPGLNQKSQAAPLSNFGEVKQVRLYKVSSASDLQASKAANYAASYLINKPYALTPDADSTTELNCATLVWQAYKAQGISLKKYFYSVIPASIVEDPQTEVVGRINWPGNDNSFAH